MTPLLVVIPVHSGDIDQALKLVAWIADLGPAPEHSCLIVRDATVGENQSNELKSWCSRIFAYTHRLEMKTNKPYPGAATQMFKAASEKIEDSFKTPFLWLEPDSVPLVTGWLNILAEAYAACPKRYFGPLIGNNGDDRFPSKHLNGVSIYPHDSAKDLKPYFPSDKSWDIISHQTTVRMAQDTDLIQQFWGPDRATPPTFREYPRTEEEPKNICTPSFIRDGAVLFHRCKDGSLIDVLRARGKDRVLKNVNPHAGIDPMKDVEPVSAPKPKGPPPMRAFQKSTKTLIDEPLTSVKLG